MSDDVLFALAHLREFPVTGSELDRLRDLRRAFDQHITEEVHQARAHGARWEDIAEAIGMSRQRASRLYGPPK